MSKDNKINKAARQRSRDTHSAKSVHSTAKTLPNMSKNGTAMSYSEPTETWAKTSERAAITRRSKNVKITLPGMPWDNKED